MFRPRFKALTMMMMLSLATLSATAFGQEEQTQPAPGRLQLRRRSGCSIEGHAINPRSVGQAEIDAGQYIATADGKAEVLLTPGVFLRLGNDTTVKMISPNLTHTEVAVEHGRATLEVDQIYKQNTLLIDQEGWTRLRYSKTASTSSTPPTPTCASSTAKLRSIPATITIQTSNPSRSKKIASSLLTETA